MSQRTARLLAVLLAVSVVTMGPSAASSTSTAVISAEADARPTAARAPGGAVGERCIRFRGARRCANWAYPADPGAPLIPYAKVTIHVFRGDDAEVRFVLFQRLTKSGWETKARGVGSGVRTSYASSSVPWRQCSDLPRGTYRSRGKVRWTNEGVRYTRWITGRKASKRALC